MSFYTNLDKLLTLWHYSLLWRLHSNHQEMGQKHADNPGRVNEGYAPQASVSGIGLVPGRNILCKLANNSPLPHHTRDKLGCCIISYRNIISFFSWQFLGNFFSNLKLSLNRGTPTLLLNLYLTYLNAIFVSFCYPEGDKKSVKMEGAK